MKPSDLKEILLPYTDELVLLAWNGRVWSPLTLEIKYSTRTGRTYAYFGATPDPPAEQCIQCGQELKDTSQR